MIHSNLILDSLPKKIDGLHINTDFRVSILFDLLMSDNNLSFNLKIAQSLHLYFGDQNIIDINAAINNILWFYSCGKHNNALPQKNKNVVKIFSFDYDADYIFSAFLAQYAIDLNDIKYMHWWKFRALFNGLNDDHIFTKIMSYRALDLNKIKDKEQKKYYKSLQVKYKLPDSRTAEEKERDFANVLG